jgi:hypothetical protein
MTGKRTHNIVTFEEDDAIVEAVQKRIGSTDYSAAIRFIIREWSLRADPDGKILKNLGNKATSTHKRNKRTMNPATIAGVRRGLESVG